MIVGNTATQLSQMLYENTGYEKTGNFKVVTRKQSDSAEVLSVFFSNRMLTLQDKILCSETFQKSEINYETKRECFFYSN